jgi:Glycosyltransferase family 87
VWRVERGIAGVDASRDELLPYVGPAAALPLFGALARLPQPLAAVVWTGLLAASGVVLVLASLLLAGTRRAGAVLGAFALAIASGPLTSAVALGQAALLSAAGIALALVAYERRGVALGALATLVAAVQPNLALALIARMRDRTALLCAALGAIAFAALTLAAGGGVRGFAAYLHRLAEHNGAERFAAIQHTPAAIAFAFGASDSTAALAGVVVAAVAVAAVAVATLRARLRAPDGALLAVAALPLAVPFFHEHDFVIELIPLTVLAVRAEGAARAWAAAAAVLALVDWLGLAQRPAAHAQIVAQGVALACAFVALGASARVRRSDLAPFAALAVLACAALPLARAFPAPTWPDGLPVAYRAPAGAGASAVWADEQRAAGLDARQPAWGALRALPPLGSIALGVAIVLYGSRCRRSSCRRTR